MKVTSINADTFAKMFLAGAKNLEAGKEWINELNVFPVPDGDTGTNMTMTIMSAVKEISAISDLTMEQLSRAISSGSLRGARGNSGVILSQLFRGFCKVIKSYDVIDVPILCEACQRAVETAYKAVMKPKEGTILTVARGMAEKALTLAEETDDLVFFAEELIRCGDEVLEQTPELLPVLKEAGVVDSGGQGLMQVVKGAYDALTGKEIDYTIDTEQVAAGPVNIAKQTEEEITFGYCTEFIILANHPMDEKEENAYKAYLETIGDCIVVVADDEIVKTHVHTNDPGLAIQKALTYGALSRIKIDNMREEHQEKLIKDAAKVAAQQKEAQRRETEAVEAEAAKADEKAEAAAQDTEQKETAFIAVSLGEGINEIFRELGVDVIVSGGQTMNPSTEDMLNAIAQVNAKNIFILPNNSNIILAANQAASLTEDRNVFVVPSKTFPQGISALVNYIPAHSAEENAATMAEEMQLVKTGQLTYAVRDTQIDGFTIHQNDFMGIGDSGILSAGTELETVMLEMIDAMVDEDSAIISIYYGEDATEEQAGRIAELLGEKYPDMEVEINNGSQPVYYYVVSVE